MDALDKILTLINAGYTRDEIAALLAGQAPAAPAAAPAAPDPAPTPAAAPAAVPVSPDPAAAAGPAAPAAPAADMGSVLAAIHTMGSNIVSALQRAQIGGTSLTPADPNSMLDAITAAIIDPPKREV